MRDWLSGMNVQVGEPPHNLSNALDGRWVNPGGYETMVAILLSETGSGNSTPTVSIQQARDASGAGAKTFTPDEWYKLDAGDLAGLKGTPDISTGDSVNIDADMNNLAYAEIRTDQLDVSGGFDWVRMRVSAATGSSAKETVILYAFFGARYAVRPDKAVAVV